MAVQKKTKPKKQVKKTVLKCPVFNWTPQKKLAALLLSVGTIDYESVAEQVDTTDRTLRRWRDSPIFMAEVDRLTLKNEQVTLAGVLRECILGLGLKRAHIEHDSNTHLHYLKAIADVRGYTKHKVEIEGNVNHTGEVVIYIPDNGRDKKQDDEPEQS